MWPKVLQHVKKSLYNQPKPYFFQKLLWSHFWINFNQFYTKAFRIVYILIVYLLIMFIWVVFTHFVFALIYFCITWLLLFMLYMYVGQKLITCMFVSLLFLPTLNKTYLFIYLLLESRKNDFRWYIWYRVISPRIPFSPWVVSPRFINKCQKLTMFFYLLCSQFRQKDSSWINKTLLLIKQQKWLSEFCVKLIWSLAKISVE
jgi:hypothetical protein